VLKHLQVGVKSIITEWLMQTTKWLPAILDALSTDIQGHQLTLLQVRADSMVVHHGSCLREKLPSSKLEKRPKCEEIHALLYKHHVTPHYYVTLNVTVMIVCGDYHKY